MFWLEYPYKLYICNVLTCALRALANKIHIQGRNTALDGWAVARFKNILKKLTFF